MPAVPLPNGQSVFLDSNGAPLVGASVYHYVPATTTFKTTWQDPGETEANTNPIILDAAGRATIWGDGTYRQKVVDQFGNLVWDQLTSGLTIAAVVAGLPVFTGDTGAGGADGLVPAPPAGSAALGEYLSADGAWGSLEVVLPPTLTPSQAGFLGAPQRIIAPSDALVLTDSGGNILYTGASAGRLTITADATASWPSGVVTLITVNNPVGSGVLSLVPDTGVSLFGPGVFPTSGTRFLAANAQVVLARISADTWTVVGAGIS